MDPRKHSTLWTSLSAAAVVAIVVVAMALYPVVGPASAAHQPADKVAAAGSTMEVMESATANGSFSQVHTLMSTEMRTSTPTDLILQVNAECALFTDVTTVGNDESQAVATVNVWVEIDGEPVPVSSDDEGEDVGKVVFCNRDYRVQTLQFENENATIKRFLHTRAANGFNWIALDLGNGVHEITVKAQLEGEATSLSEGNAHAKAVVGKRTLVAEPVKLPHDATVS